MKTTAALASLLAAAVSAQTQSPPFTLVISSDDASVDKKSFTACHSGAAIESLCIYSAEGTNFHFNTTEGSTAPIDGYTPSGSLVYNLPLGDDDFVSEPMSLSVNPSSNVALPLLQPGYDTQSVAFDGDDNLAIFSYYDDSKEDPTSGEVRAINNWYACQTYYAGYQYQTLAWVLGKEGSKPQNPSCIKIDVKRVFA